MGAIARSDLLEWFNYDPGTGVITWRKRPKIGGGSAKVGDVAGSINTRGNVSRRILWLKTKRIYAARAGYIMVCGDIPPEALIDHIDGDTLNNRIGNLRLASGVHNVWNRTQRDGSAYQLGVSKGIRGRFKARIQLPTGEKLNLGTWETEAEAHAAYMGAAAILHGEFWIGHRDQAKASKALSGRRRA